MFNQPLDHLPSNLTCFTLDQHIRVDEKANEYKMALDNLPWSLTSLTLTNVIYTHPLGHLPPSLLELNLYSNLKCVFNEPLYHLPASLHILKLPKYYSKPLPVLPTNLIKLEFTGKYFEQDTSRWPKDLVVTVSSNIVNFIKSM